MKRGKLLKNLDRLLSVDMIENVTMEKLDYYQRLRNFDPLEIGERNFAIIINEFTASIDAYDPMTAGHSKKVSEYCLGICDELDISGDYKEMIRIAALLHDYGKVGIPAAILKKPVGDVRRQNCMHQFKQSGSSRRIGEAGIRILEDLSTLVSERFGDNRLGMANAGNTPPRCEINIPVIFLVPDKDSFTPFYGDFLFNKKRCHIFVFNVKRAFACHDVSSTPFI